MDELTEEYRSLLGQTIETLVVLRPPSMTEQEAIQEIGLVMEKLCKS